MIGICSRTSGIYAIYYESRGKRLSTGFYFPPLRFWIELSQEMQERKGRANALAGFRE
jgi:hypothetical protein